MGKFLKENPQYDFDELAISKLNYSKIVDGKAIRNDWLYIVATQDKKLHIVFEDFDDASSFVSRAVAANDFIVSYRQESMRLKFGDGKIVMQDLKNPNARFHGKIEFSKKSNYEQMRKLADSYGASGDKEGQAECLKILEDMTGRISDRRNVKLQSVDDIEL